MNIAIARRSSVFLLMAVATCPMLSLAQTCPPDRIYADGFDGVPVQRLHLVFSTQPSTTPVSAVISPAVAVSVLDQCNNPIGGKNVQMTIGANPPNPAVLSGTQTVPSNALGSANFGDLHLSYEGYGYTLVATVAGPGGTFSATSASFDEIRVGDACLGPIAACGSGCADADGDGLNDAWEIAGGIDLNGDGLITSQYDTLLPGADPNVPDIFVQYDWMGYGTKEQGCSIDANCVPTCTLCPPPPPNPETCTGPAVPNYAHSCAQQCASDAQCTALGPSHIGDRCIAAMCQHTHDPDLLAPTALADVVESFANHGIHLHLMRGHELPHSHVLSFRTPVAGCEGATIPPGVVGGYAVDLYDLKSASFNARQALSHHYGVFAHNSSCDTSGHCLGCPVVKGSTPSFGQSGIAELPGNDFMVSLGHVVNDHGIAPNFANLGGTFMHELGHNLGLHHAGGSTAPGTVCAAPYCEDGPGFKPNYLSIMNYRYQYPGILVGAAIGSNSPITCSDDSACPSGTHCNGGVNGTCSRLDYSNDTLPTGGNTPGALTESGQLNELAGLGSGTADLFIFDDGQCRSPVIAATQGPVDWDGNGIAGDNLYATVDLNESDHGLNACFVTDQVLRGHTDWGPAPGQSIFTYAFQCTSGGADAPTKSRSRPALLTNQPPVHEWIENELTPETAAQAHVLYPPRRVPMRLPGCARADLQPMVASLVRILLPGAVDFNVADVDRSSLRFHGATPSHVETADADGDGIDDLIVYFPADTIRLSSRATQVRLSGWLNNSQVFVAEEALCR